VISQTLFAILVIMAVATTMMAPPLLHLLGYHQENRLEDKEALELSGDNVISQP
jgi:hypothetical protein